MNRPSPAIAGAFPAGVLAIAAGLWLAPPVRAEGSPAQAGTAPDGNPPPFVAGAPRPGASPSDAGDAGPADWGRELMRIRAGGAFSAAQARAGDSLEYRIEVEWPEEGGTILFSAPRNPEFHGLKTLSRSTVHRKSARGDSVFNRAEYVYVLRAELPGAAKASATSLDYRDESTGRPGTLSIPGMELEVLPASVPLSQKGWFRALLVLAAAGTAGGGIYAGRRRFLRAGRRNPPSREDLRPALESLRRRLPAADSRALLEEMEALAVRHLKQDPGTGHREGSGGGPLGSGELDGLLVSRLARCPERDREGWRHLRDLFRHARFAGGHRERHELEEDLRILERCMQVTGEEKP